MSLSARGEVAGAYCEPFGRLAGGAKQVRTAGPFARGSNLASSTAALVIAIGLIGATMFFRRDRLILDSPFASVMRLPTIEEPGLSLWETA